MKDFNREERQQWISEQQSATHDEHGLWFDFVLILVVILCLDGINMVVF